MNNFRFSPLSKQDHLTNDEIRTADARGRALAARVIARYETADVFEIAARARVRVVYKRWPPVTVGECEPRASVIRINLAALDGADEACNEEFSRTILTSVILAHELGHLFDERLCAQEMKKRVGRATRERVAHAFADSLLNLPRGYVEYERYWQRSYERRTLLGD